LVTMPIHHQKRMIMMLIIIRPWRWQQWSRLLCKNIKQTKQKIIN
jgi:hypothetical protein